MWHKSTLKSPLWRRKGFIFKPNNNEYSIIISKVGESKAVQKGENGSAEEFSSRLMLGSTVDLISLRMDLRLKSIHPHWDECTSIHCPNMDYALNLVLKCLILNI